MTPSLREERPNQAQCRSFDFAQDDTKGHGYQKNRGTQIPSPKERFLRCARISLVFLAGCKSRPCTCSYNMQPTSGLRGNPKGRSLGRQTCEPKRKQNAMLNASKSLDARDQPTGEGEVWHPFGSNEQLHERNEPGWWMAARSERRTKEPGMSIGSSGAKSLCSTEYANA